jgi:hypothetical protein
MDAERITQSPAFHVTAHSGITKFPLLVKLGGV